ncbi:hypothetical protein CYV19_08705 [Natronobacterium gregoryi SP2]|uniref:Uncharacterized protein n=1 Tax=Natronobacterium gregoryi (strain ATCC 43098 / DSM 3393 / CCM 3738 / CIP 104747 / IAM 13177 / JCM 8860 / NBRC 102187 / NCIMB 2189 / SP2) TaxID=797304 RepID=L9Y7W8_NATGS|nr:hypothetical protein C490_08381 [Natronobacterium gregoryi SP2]PLK20664.1 hypothetical protein CYV19_08705 [Natronobacterium gregoryi SP2]
MLGASAGTVALAGCASVANFLADMILDDVNVFNGTERELSGSIEVTDPDETVVLEERFEVVPDDDDDDDDVNEDSGEVYGDVFTDDGEYVVSIELDDGSEIDGERTADETVEITDVEEDHVAVLLGADGAPDPISVVVIQEFTDIGEYVEE